MKTILLPNNVEVKIYSNAKEMPIVRFNEFNKYLLFESGIGNDMKAIEGHYARCFAFIRKGEYDELKQEMENLYYSHYAILNNLDFKSLAFAAMVHSYGDKVFTDISEEGLKEVADLIAKSGMTREDLEFTIDDVKKK